MHGVPQMTLMSQADPRLLVRNVMQLMEEAKSRDAQNNLNFKEVSLKDFVEAATVGELQPGDIKLLEVGDERIALANMDGTYYAFGDLCTHMDCSLSDGTLEGNGVECPCHGSVFNLETGAVKEGPAEDPIVTYGVRIEGERIFVGPA